MSDLLSPVVLEGAPFPWDEPNPCGEPVGADGEVNWMAAAFADPGVASCVGCDSYLWREGSLVMCPACGLVQALDARPREDRSHLELGGES